MKAKNKAIAHTQDHEISHSMAHYLLTIHKLKEDKGYARVTDIAKDLGLTKGSVSTALNTLRRRDLVGEEPESKFVDLTERGHEEVHHILSSRTLLYYFFKSYLKVSDDLCRKDSCLMEHLMSSETREKLFEFMKLIAEERGIDTGLDFTRYRNYDEFLEDQKGDTYLA